MIDAKQNGGRVEEYVEGLFVAASFEGFPAANRFACTSAAKAGLSTISSTSPPLRRGKGMQANLAVRPRTQKWTQQGDTKAGFAQFICPGG